VNHESAGMVRGSVAGSPGAERHEFATLIEASRSRLDVVLLLLVSAGVAWWSTSVRMGGMDAGPGTSLGALGWFTGVWTVMMAAMMIPSLTPTAAVYATLARRREPSWWLLFAGGYLLAWSAAGLVAYSLFELGTDLFAGALGWHAGGRWLTAGVLASAALYQFTPVKSACLARCRSPRQLLAGRWLQGRAGAVAMGVRSGRWCIGCSWALMVALFALGVMSLSWMALVAALVVFEKLGPWPRAASVATAVVLGALTVGIVISPHEIPGLVVPGSHGAMHAMKAMG
jgi:predicted metal-binding membrane protein